MILLYFFGVGAVVGYVVYDHYRDQINAFKFPQIKFPDLSYNGIKTWVDKRVYFQSASKYAIAHNDIVTKNLKEKAEIEEIKKSYQYVEGKKNVKKLNNLIFGGETTVSNSGGGGMVAPPIGVMGAGGNGGQTYAVRYEGETYKSQLSGNLTQVNHDIEIILYVLNGRFPNAQIELKSPEFDHYNQAHKIVMLWTDDKSVRHQAVISIPTEDVHKDPELNRTRITKAATDIINKVNRGEAVRDCYVVKDAIFSNHMTGQTTVDPKHLGTFGY